MARTRRRGNSAIEFTLVGIPVMFGLISIFELSRGMWEYHTLAHAVKEGVRYTIVHGYGCEEPPYCRVTVGDIAGQIRRNGPGLVADRLELQFIPKRGPVVQCLLSDCVSRTSATDVWPPSAVAIPGSYVTIRGTYEVRSILLMLTPAGGTGGFLKVRLPASSTEMIQY